MTPRDTLEQLLMAGDVALELLILRRLSAGERYEDEVAYTRLADNLGARERDWYRGICKSWGYTDGDYWPIRGPEKIVENHYKTVDTIIQDALELGFIDQAVRISAAWKKGQ